MKVLEKVTAWVVVTMMVSIMTLFPLAESNESDYAVDEIAGYGLLTEEAQKVIAELSEDADSVRLYLPELQKAASTTDDNSAYAMISKTEDAYEVNGVFYEEKEETLLALTSTPSGSYSASGQAYGISASNTVSVTWSYTDSVSLSDLKIKFNSMTAKYTYLPTQSTTVTKLEFSASLQPPYGSYDYLSTKSVSSPSSGVSYTKSLNSSYYLYGGDTAYAMITVYYANGSSSTYAGAL